MGGGMEAGDGVRLQEIGSGEVRLVYMQRSWMALGADNSYAVKMSMRKLDARIAILRRLRMVVRANDRRRDRNPSGQQSTSPRRLDVCHARGWTVFCREDGMQSVEDDV